MNAPVATYRVQLNRENDFNQLRETVPYLAKLGISHVYASPIFQARKGSTHGYDIVDFNKISEELGGASAFEELCIKLKSHGLQWIQDIVPNHMAYSTENKMIFDILKNGAISLYHGYPDVDWNHPSKQLKGKILAPFLEDSYQKCLKLKEIKLVHENNDLAVEYKGMRFPIKKDTYTEITSESSKEYYRDLKQLRRLLPKQVYFLAQWKTALRRINYRRFFDVAGIISLRSEKAKVFETTHKLLFDLMKRTRISGVRIDHVDGLFDPEEYIDRIRENSPNAFAVVEKILSEDEELPQTWKVQGTTGYDFLNQLNRVFVDGGNEAEFDAAYQGFTRDKKSFSQHQYECKKRVAQEYFRGDIDNLAWKLESTLQIGTFTHDELRDALIELFSCLPVYRTYLTQRSVIDKELLENLTNALALAKKTNVKTRGALAFVEKLLGERARNPKAVSFFMRLQQFTGAIMAKGVEDTAFYVYNRLLSLNEVGSSPARFGVSREHFHAFIQRRQQRWPLSLNTTSTHDSKRGEDARARLNVLSEIPLEFNSHMQKWSKQNAQKKKRIGRKLAPDRNEEYYLYQTLLGAYPSDQKDVPEFANRVREHMIKAIREAKRNSSWISPSYHYEEGVAEFAAELLDPKKGSDFLKAFVPFQKKIAYYGVFNSLAQTLVKMTCPGTPDFYQGAELWDFNLVDPDNRRTVNFQKRRQLLDEVLRATPSAIPMMLKKTDDGKVKLYEIHRALKVRKKRRKLFQEGTYVPLKAKGKHSRNIIAFCRRNGEAFAMVIVPRFLTSILKPFDSFGTIDWRDTSVCFPAKTPRHWTEIFTERQITPNEKRDEEQLMVGDVLESFPAALLLSSEL